MMEYSELIPVSGTVSQFELLQKIVELKNQIPLDSPKKKQKNPVEVYSIPAAFDIEASSWIDADGNKRATMYIWQFGIMNYVTYGRTWGEFLVLLGTLASILETNHNKRLYVYVHNLAYDFQFLRKWLQWEKVFLLDRNEPVYALSTLGIEFRCSYKLSNRSLRAVGDELQKYKVKKLLGDLDYLQVRHSETPLTEKELKYCENDIRVVLAYIQEKIETDGILGIPLTNTGYVRNKCRENCFRNYKQYRKVVKELTLEPEEYLQLRAAFSGGFTHGNSFNRMWVWHDIASYDFTSSYPAVMLYEKFPMSKGEYKPNIKTKEDVVEYSKNYCMVFTAFFNIIVSKFKWEHMLSKHKCNKDKLTAAVIDNGRIVTAKNVEVVLTEQDFLAILEFYDVDEIEISNCWIYQKGYLPLSFIRTVIQFYKDKTTLKGNPDKQLEYMISKNMLNSTYGMCVTDIIRDILEYDLDYLEPRKPDLEVEIEKYNKKANRFLSYAWGVWVTAYARTNLYKAILHLKQDYLYSDTDSVKFRNYENHKSFFENYNNDIKRKVKIAAEHFHLTEEDYSPRGKFIGIWDFEGVYKRFKYMNAKRYIVEDENGHISVTIAGASKQLVPLYLRLLPVDPFVAFNENLQIPVEYSGRTVHQYINDEQDDFVTDYLGKTAHYYEKSAINIMPTTYSMSMTDEFRRYLSGKYYQVERC